MNSHHGFLIQTNVRFQISLAVVVHKIFLFLFVVVVMKRNEIRFGVGFKIRGRVLNWYTKKSCNEPSTLSVILHAMTVSFDFWIHLVSALFLFLFLAFWLFCLVFHHINFHENSLFIFTLHAHCFSTLNSQTEKKKHVSRAPEHNQIKMKVINSETVTRHSSTKSSFNRDESASF